MHQEHRFCEHCGFKGIRDAVFCGACGERLHPLNELLKASQGKAAFGVGGEVQQMASEASTSLNTPGRLLGLPSLAAVLVLLLLGWWFTRPPGPKGVSPYGNTPMPAVNLVDSSGVSVQVPEGGFPEGFELKLEVLQEGPEPEPLQRRSQFFVFDGVSFLPGLQPAEVVIPVEGTAEDCAVLVESMGRWLSVPSQPTQTDDGRQALRVRVDGLPFPWRLTVASHPEGYKGFGALVAGSSLEAQLQRLEQLRVVDRQAFQKEIAKLPPLDSFEELSSLDGVQKGRSIFLSPAYAQRQTQPRPPSRFSVESELKRVRANFLLADSAYGNRDLDPANRERSFHYYRQGVQALARAKAGVQQLSQEDKGTLLRDSDLALGASSSAIVSGSWRLDHMIEQYCGLFAPWGVELTSDMVADPELASRGFDIGVLPYFGHLLYVDVSNPQVPTAIPLYDGEKIGRRMDEDQRRWAGHLRLVKEEAKRYELLRIYSPRLYSWSPAEIVNYFKTGVSYAGSVLGVAKLYAGGPKGAVLYLAVFEIIIPFVDSFFTEDQAKRLQRDEVLNQGTFFQLYDSLKLVGSLVVDTKTRALDRSGWVEAALSFVVDYDKIIRTEELRALSGDAKGYTDRSGWWRTTNVPVPPILMVTNIFGPTNHRHASPDGLYPIKAGGTQTFHLSYPSLIHRRAVRWEGGTTHHRYDLAYTFAQGIPELGEGLDQDMIRPSRRDSSIFGTEWFPCLQHLWGAKTWLRDDAPHAQVIRWVLPDSVLEGWAGQAGLDPQEFLQQARVKITYASRPRSVGFMNTQDYQSDIAMAHLRRPESEAPAEKVQVFSVVLGPTGFGDFSDYDTMAIRDNWTPEKFGKWADHFLLNYSEQPRKNFVIIVSLDKKELLRFTAGFEEFAVGEGYTFYDEGPNSKTRISLVTVYPETPEPGLNFRVSLHSPSMGGANPMGGPSSPASSRTIYLNTFEGENRAQVSFVALPSPEGPYRYLWDLGDGTRHTDTKDQGERSSVEHTYTGLSDGQRFLAQVTLQSVESNQDLATDSVEIVAKVAEAVYRCDNAFSCEIKWFTPEHFQELEEVAKQLARQGRSEDAAKARTKVASERARFEHLKATTTCNCQRRHTPSSP